MIGRKEIFAELFANQFKLIIMSKLMVTQPNSEQWGSIVVIRTIIVAFIIRKPAKRVCFRDLSKRQIERQQNERKKQKTF